MKTVKQKIEKFTKDFYAKNGRFPSNSEYIKILGIKYWHIHKKYCSVTALRAQILAESPEIQEDIEEKEDIIKLNHPKDVQKKINKYKRFFITTAVSGANVHEKFYQSIKNYCKRNKALLLLLSSADKSAFLGKNVDDIIRGETFIFNYASLNSNLCIHALDISSKQVNPITGLGRIGQRNGSSIYASPKQSLEYMPVGNNKLPHALMTTGAITHPNYRGEKEFFAKKSTFVADSDHIMGGVIVEIQDDKVYHFRQVQMNSQGGFTDIDTSYLPNGKVRKSTPKAFIPGDWHTGATDPELRKAIFKMIIKLRPEELILHDMFDANSVNHWLKNNHIALARRSKDPVKNTLELELKQLGCELKAMEALPLKRISIVKSNHDDFLIRYLQAGDYLKDPQNIEIAHMLSYGAIQGKDPLPYGLSKLGFRFNKTKFLQRDVSHLICGIETGAHFDKGSGGRKNPTLPELEKAYLAAVGGHSHTAGLLRRIIRVGTSTKLRESYAIGPISWTQTGCLIHPDKTYQLINFIDNKYTI